MARYPNSWSAYIKQVGVNDIPPEAGEFAARYSMAMSYSKSTFSKMHARTQRDYSLLIRSGLAYSALESLARLINVGKKIPLTLDNTDLIAVFRDEKFSEFIDVLKENAIYENQQQALHNFRIGELLDLHPVAASIRHLTFHGIGNPNKLGLNNSRYIRTGVDDLADYQLDFINVEFRKFVEAMTTLV